MNRFASLSVLFAGIAIATWGYFITPVNKTSGIPLQWKDYAHDTREADGSRLIGMKSAEREMLKRFQKNNGVVEGGYFSRMDSTPRQYYRDAFTKFDKHQPDPQRLFTGTLKIVTDNEEFKKLPYEKRPGKSYPFIVDRRSGKTRIFVDGWLDYDRWLVKQTGLPTLGKSKGM